MKNLILNFNDTKVIVKQTKDGLYSLNDLHRASGLTGLLTDLVRHLSEKAICRFDISRIKGGKYQGTYANEKGVYWFAAKVNEDFEDAVYEAFKLLVHGKTEEAKEVVDQRVLQSAKLYREGKGGGYKLKAILKELCDTPFDMIPVMQNISDKITCNSTIRMKFWNSAKDNVAAIRQDYRMTSKNFNSSVFEQYEKPLHYTTKRISQLREMQKNGSNKV